MYFASFSRNTSSTELTHLDSRQLITLAVVISFLLHAVILITNWSKFYPKDHVLESPLPEMNEIIAPTIPIKIKQIVNNTDQGEDKLVPDAKYLSEKNRSFEKQTRARIIDTFKEGGGSQVKKNEKQITSLKDLAINPSSIAKAVPIQKQDSAGNASGVTSNNDFLDEVPLGDLTNLNTKEFKFFGFYQRIRKKLEAHWGRSLQDKSKILYKTGRRLAASDNHITSISVAIDHQGKIVKVILDSTSGVKELDDAAVESFNKAGPFPNPPKEMIGQNGVAIIKWGFVVKT